MPSPKHQIEALLFSSGKTMTEEQIVELSKLDTAKVKRTLKALQKDYADRDSAVTIVNDARGWKMTVHTEHIPLVKNVVADTELSKACLETLAVIAFKHPEAMQSEVVETRGGGAYEHIKELDKLGFVRKEPSGRSYKLKLTDQFFTYFEVAGESDIRQVFKGVEIPDKAEVQKQLGEMDVVKVEEEKKEEEKPTGELEVVDVSEKPEHPAILDEKPKEEEHEEAPQDEDHQNFLDDLDAKIAKIATRNDDHDSDPLLQRPADEESEGEESDSGEEDESEEPPRAEEPESSEEAPADEEALK